MDLSAFFHSGQLQARPYQERIIRRAFELYTDKGLRSVLIDSPTGSGKTIMGLLIARLMQQTHGVRVGWVAMRRYLLEQAKTENADRKIGLDVEFLSMFDREPALGLEMLVIDEAQHDAAASMAHLHQIIRPRWILGLSATPFRGDAVKLCFDTILKDAGIQSLIQDGYLSPYHHYTIPQYSPKEVVACYLSAPARWGRSIFFFHTLEQCAEADALLRHHGVRTAMVRAGGAREEQLEAFREGRLEVLTNCMVLSEGFDCPDLQTVFCRPSCKGVTVQMCGRVLRPYPGLAYKQIVQCQRTRWPFPRTARAAIQYLWQGEEWRSLEINPRIHHVSGRALAAMVKQDTELPTFLTAKTPRRRTPSRGRRTTTDASLPVDTN